MKKLIYFVVLLVFISVFQAKSTTSSPKILDHYPNCDYLVIDTINLNKRISWNKETNSYQPSIDQNIPLLLNLLRERAISENADAILIIARELKETAMTKVNKTVSFGYKAQLIKQCDELTGIEKKPTPIDHNGQLVVNRWKKTSTITMKTVLPQRKKLRRPKIEQTEVSIDTGVYGVKPGDTYQQVIELLGDPDAVFSFSRGLLVTGYGRRHWFHFSDNRVEKVTTHVSFVTDDILNKIPMRHYFDDYQWKINDQISYKMSLGEVKKRLGSSLKILNKKQAVIQQKDKRMDLIFDLITDPWTEQKNSLLDGFSLSNGHFKTDYSFLSNDWTAQFQWVAESLIKIAADQEVGLSEFIEGLGEPIGRIILAKEKELLIFNPYLIVEANRGHLAKIQLTEYLFDSGVDGYSGESSWNIERFYHGQEYSEVRKKLFGDIMDSEFQLELNGDSFQMTLLFEERKGIKKLYELELIQY